MRRTALAVWLAAVIAVAAGAACVAPLGEAGSDDDIDVQRVASSVSVRRSRHGVEQLRIDVAVDAAAGGTGVGLRAAGWTGSAAPIASGPTAPGEEFAFSIDAVATGPGVPITATVRTGAAVLEIRNGLVLQGDVASRLADWRERNQVVAMLAPIAPALAAVAPYRTAIEARLPEAAPAFVAVGLFQAWPDGIEPAWPVLDDARDVDPPGHLAGDVVGLGMTCSAMIRCPNSAPYCVTVDHATEFGVCTRACVDDTACAVVGGAGRCTQPVVDIPDVAGPVLTCEIGCTAGACPGRLTCDAVPMICRAAPR